MTALASLLLITAVPQKSASDLAKWVHPLAPAIKCPKIEVDASDFPEGEVWIKAAKSVVENWFGNLTQLLATDGRDPVTGMLTGTPYNVPKTIHLVVRAKIDPPAYASGDTITVKGPWIAQHPDDLGMIIHELTHVLQSYPDSDKTPGWLVEGVADYIRWWRYEPELHATSGRTKINFEKANYTDAYRTTGMWLAWASKKYDMRLVPSLDLAMRSKQDPLPVFKKLTGKTPDELWADFKATY